MKEKENRAKILSQPSYWVEGVNAYLYDAIVSYMEKNNLKQKDLAEHLGISKGRVSQILNDGEINFSLEKIIQIALKVDKIPDFRFVDKTGYKEKNIQKTPVRKYSTNSDSRISVANEEKKKYKGE